MEQSTSISASAALGLAPDSPLVLVSAWDAEDSETSIGILLLLPLSWSWMFSLFSSVDLELGVTIFKATIKSSRTWNEPKCELEKVLKQWTVLKWPKHDLEKVQKMIQKWSKNSSNDSKKILFRKRKEVPKEFGVDKGQVNWSSFNLDRQDVKLRFN